MPMSQTDLRTQSKTSVYLFIGIAVGFIAAAVAVVWYLFSGPR